MSEVSASPHAPGMLAGGRVSHGIAIVPKTVPHPPSSGSNELLLEVLGACTLCPHRCGANRLAGRGGRCGAGKDVVIYRWGPHMGEEPPISGYRGSGTVFFSTCPLRCVYCQNHRWSQSRPPVGDSYSVSELALLFLKLQEMGCHNVNLVTPEPWIPHIVAALAAARSRGLSIPVVYNTSGFVTEESLQALEGVVDIYLTDLRYADAEQARRLSGSATYFEASRRAARSMWAQVGPLVCSPDGIAQRGVVVRHLIIPGLDATKEVLRFVAEELSPQCHVSLMGQFMPAHLASEMEPLRRGVTRRHYAHAVHLMRTMGLHQGWRQLPGEPEEALMGEAMEPTSREELFFDGSHRGDGTVGRASLT